MYESISDRDLQRTKKPHCCDWCGELIEAGSPAHYRAYRYDGEFLQSYQHPECYTAMMHSIEDSEDDGYETGAYLRGKTVQESMYGDKEDA